MGLIIISVILKRPFVSIIEFLFYDIFKSGRNYIQVYKKPKSSGNQCDIWDQSLLIQAHVGFITGVLFYKIREERCSI